MAEHYTQGRQGQGSRRRRNNNRGNAARRRRMPRPESAPVSKPSLVKRILRFFGIGKAKEAPEASDKRKAPKSNVRVAKGRTNNRGGNPAAARKGRRATSTPPTRNARLYVGNLSYEATESELEDLFKGFGHVRSVEVIYNSRTYKSKGYAFVEMVNLADARRAAEVLHGQPFMGRELMVSAASDKTERAEETLETTEEAPAVTTAEAPAAEGEPQES